MTVSPRARAGALIDDAKQWQAIDWKATQRQVRRLQMRIAKAVKEGKPGKVKSLQWLLTHSHHAKLLAVRRVTSNICIRATVENAAPSTSETHQEVAGTSVLDRRWSQMGLRGQIEVQGKDSRLPGAPSMLHRYHAAHQSPSRCESVHAGGRQLLLATSAQQGRALARCFIRPSTSGTGRLTR